MAHAHHAAVKIGFGSPNIKAKCVRIVGNAERKTFKTYKSTARNGLTAHQRNKRGATKEKNVGQDDFDEQTPYHIRKGIDLIGAKLEGNNVVIPIFNAKKERVGKQTITPDGTKKFSKNMQAEGSFGVCGKIAPGKLYVAEGYALVQAFTQRQKPTPYSHYQAATCPKSVKPYKQRFLRLNWWLQQTTTRQVSRRRKLVVGHTPRPKSKGMIGMMYSLKRARKRSGKG